VLDKLNLKTAEWRLDALLSCRIELGDIDGGQLGTHDIYVRKSHALMKLDD
jgi:hypothetical protein